MRRREVITLLGGAAVTWPLAARGQQVTRAARIGCLVTGSQQSHGPFIAMFAQGLAHFGYVEGRDFVLDVRWAQGRTDLFPMLSEELAGFAPDVVVTATAGAALAAKQAMPTIPIVVANLTDPIGLGLVTSYNRPGGTITGVMLTLEGLLGKQLELAREVMPGANKLGMLVNMRNPSNVSQRRDAEAAAPVLGIELTPVDIRSSAEIEAAFQTFTRERSEFVLVLSDLIFTTARRRIAELAMAARLPTMYGLREHTEDGGLVSYGVSLRENWRRSAYFVDRILKGAKPADLPVELPAKLEMVFNLKTAKALGLTIQEAFLMRVDEVIE
jgi:putative ABC transport system substrate-binding protein